LLSALRVTERVLGESRVGFIVTDGDPTGSHNTLAGADFQYRNSHLAGDNIFQSDLYYERSFYSALGQDDAFGAVLNYPNDPWGRTIGLPAGGREFCAGLGFVNRPGIRDYEATISEKTRYRNPFLRWLQFGASGNFITGLDNQLQSSLLRVWARSNHSRPTPMISTSTAIMRTCPLPFSCPRAFRCRLANTIVSISDRPSIRRGGDGIPCIGRSSAAASTTEPMSNRISR
jgi:hypothetical protein